MSKSILHKYQPAESSRESTANVAISNMRLPAFLRVRSTADRPRSLHSLPRLWRGSAMTAMKKVLNFILSRR